MNPSRLDSRLGVMAVAKSKNMASTVYTPLLSSM